MKSLVKINSDSLMSLCKDAKLSIEKIREHNLSEYIESKMEERHGIFRRKYSRDEVLKKFSSGIRFYRSSYFYEECMIEEIISSINSPGVTEFYISVKDLSRLNNVRNYCNELLL